MGMGRRLTEIRILDRKLRDGDLVVMKLAKKPAQSALEAIPNPNTVGAICTEKHYTVSELAELWNLSENTIRRIFEDEPGVLKWGSSEGRFRRRYTTLRIPETVMLRVHRRLQSAG
jgi:hypothetical protein